MYNVKMLRGTIFSAPIQYSKKFVEDLAETVPSYVPVLVRDSGIPPILPVWQLTSPDEKDFLAFTGEKIDFVRVVEGEIGRDDMCAFVSRCNEVFGKVMLVAGNICTRVAFAPSLIVSNHGCKPTALYEKIYKIHSYDGVGLDTSSMNQVYRIKKNIDDQEVAINLLANFYAEEKMMGNSSMKSESRYICDFDINTSVNPANRFTSDRVAKILEVGLVCFEEFQKLYFE